jgi:hypothetical protein
MIEALELRLRNGWEKIPAAGPVERGWWATWLALLEEYEQACDVYESPAPVQVDMAGLPRAEAA